MENVKETIKERMLGYINEQDLNMFSFVIDDGSEVEKVKIKRANPCNNSYSVAKAFAMTAIGMLYDEGKLSINDKITDSSFASVILPCAKATRASGTSI